MKNRLWESVTVFATGMSAADWAWRLLTILIIGGGGTVTGFLASISPLFRQVGALVWAGIGLFGALGVAAIFYLVKVADSKSAYAAYTRAVSQPTSRVNPLLDNFNDQIIPMEELRLPGSQIHENKHFKRCSFVGPAAVVIMGGTYVRTGFIESGDLIPIPERTLLTGIIVFKNCTVEDCKFYRTTILISKDQAAAVASAVPGTRIAGA